MVAAPKFPRECNVEYALNKQARRRLTDCEFILTMPVSEFGNIQRHIECIPEYELMTKKPEDVYRDIKDALYKGVFLLHAAKNRNQLHQGVHSCQGRERAPLGPEENIERRQQAYAQAQHLGNALTMKGLVEFKDQYITASTLAEGSRTPILTSTETDTSISTLAEGSRTPILTSTETDTSTSTLAEGSRTPILTSTETDTSTSTSAEGSRTPILTSTETDTFCTSTSAEGSRSSTSTASQDGIATSIKFKKSCTLEKNKKKITIFHPTAYLTSPDKPKIQHIDREAIKDFCDIAMEFLVHTDKYENEEAIEEYKSYADDQDRLLSFESFPGVKEFISTALKTDKENLVQELWNNDTRLKATGSARTLMDIISYTLTDFSSNCKQPIQRTNNHERTPFVKYIVPMFKYFSQETNLIEFAWCEKGLETYGMAALESNDFVLNHCSKKYADALGKNTMTDNEEFFIESSSGFDKENVNHSLDDTLKLLAECSNALLHIIKHNKKASIDTISRKCVFGIQVIKQTLTLTKVSLSKSGKWKLVEVRSACAPTSWELRSHWNPLFELLATMYHELLQQRELDAQINDEVCGLVELPSVSVVNHFLDMNA
ncbi:hypothetical protein MBANPS3_009446 [Mucor bainieri]